MQTISYDTAQKHSLIRFRSLSSFGRLEDAFYIENNRSIRLLSGYDGTIHTYACQYVDPHHVKIGDEVLHIDQFAERNAQGGNLIEPLEPITDLSYYSTIYPDYNLRTPDGQPLPFRQIVHFQNMRASEPYITQIAICPQADEMHTACVISQYSSSPIVTFLSLAQLQQRVYQDLYSSLSHWDRQLLDSVLRDILRAKSYPDLNTRILKAEKHLEIPEHFQALPLEPER